MAKAPLSATDQMRLGVERVDAAKEARLRDSGSLRAVQDRSRDGLRTVENEARILFDETVAAGEQAVVMAVAGKRMGRAAACDAVERETHRIRAAAQTEFNTTMKTGRKTRREMDDHAQDEHNADLNAECTALFQILRNHETFVVQKLTTLAAAINDLVVASAGNPAPNRIRVTRCAPYPGSALLPPAECAEKAQVYAWVRESGLSRLDGREAPRAFREFWTDHPGESWKIVYDACVTLTRGAAILDWGGRYG
jgi:hypothetical protein